MGWFGMSERKIIVSPPGYLGHNCWRWELKGASSSHVEQFYVRKAAEVIELKEGSYGVLTRDMFIDGKMRKDQRVEFRTIDWGRRNDADVVEALGKQARDYAVDSYNVRVEEVSADGGLLRVLKE